MLLTILTLSCFAFGLSDVIEEELCYGRNFYSHFDYGPPFFRGQMYFTPSKKGAPSKLVMENGEVKDPRLTVSTTSITLRDLTERDDGTFSISFDGYRQQGIIKLKILECAEQVERSYMESYSHKVRDVEFLEFTSMFSLDPPRVLWNRSDPKTNKGRGRVNHNVWKVNELTQADNGFYNFRKKDNTLQFRIKLTVKEHTRHYDDHDVKVNEEKLLMRYPWGYIPWTMTFTPKGNKRSIMLMKDSYLVEHLNLMGRLQMVNGGIEIDPVESTDSGIYEFRDQKGNLALVVQVEVDNEYAPVYFYVLIIVGIILVVIVCCCCLKKCCCKKSSAKRQSTPQTAAAPAVYYHGTNQPAGPSYSAVPPAPAYSNQSLNPLGTREPATSLGPPAYNTVAFHVNPTQPEVAVPGGQGAAPALSIGSDRLSTDSGPRFELKGVTFPSAPPLSSDSSYCDVYTSDKLNFL